MVFAEISSMPPLRYHLTFICLCISFCICICACICICVFILAPSQAPHLYDVVRQLWPVLGPYALLGVILISHDYDYDLNVYDD